MHIFLADTTARLPFWEKALTLTAAIFIGLLIGRLVITHRRKGK
jgi:uncharacterized membrane protein YhhN